jgi:hypothetical protein
MTAEAVKIPLDNFSSTLIKETIISSALQREAERLNDD